MGYSVVQGTTLPKATTKNICILALLIELMFAIISKDFTFGIAQSLAPVSIAPLSTAALQKTKNEDHCLYTAFLSTGSSTIAPLQNVFVTTATLKTAPW